MPHLIEKFSAGLLCAFSMASLSASAHASDAYPTQPIRIVVPYGAGGGPDVAARLIAQKVSDKLGQSVIVDNRPGGNGILAAQAVMSAKPDGYTVLIADTGHLGINPNLYRNLPYDPVADFDPIGLAVLAPLFLVVKEDLPVKTVQELIAYSKANPDKLSYGSSGNGSPHHLGMERLKSMTGADLTHIPFKGVAQSVPALVGGEIQLMFVALPSVAGYLKTGKLRTIAVGSPLSSPLLPNVPPVRESGIKDFEISSRIGFLAPKGTPANRIETLNKAIKEALLSSDVSTKLPSIGLEPLTSTSQEYAQVIQDELATFKKLVAETGLQVD